MEIMEQAEDENMVSLGIVDTEKRDKKIPVAILCLKKL